MAKVMVRSGVRYTLFLLLSTIKSYRSQTMSIWACKTSFLVVISIPVCTNARLPPCYLSDAVGFAIGIYIKYVFSKNYVSVNTSSEARL